MDEKHIGKLGIAIVGCGTVGGATAAILTGDRTVLESKINSGIELRYIVDMDFTHARQMKLDEKFFCDDLDKALNDPKVGVVVELVGGTTIAKDIVIRALHAGKHIVTANKALLAHHGDELYALARRLGLSIAFEASCAGGIPIIRALSGGLIANRIDAIYGIVNGTCNYILTEMTEKGQSYADALADAQKDGLAEADPALDVGGGDSAHKLAIMASLAFGRKIDFTQIPTSGIDWLELCDIEYGHRLGFVIKLLAIATRQHEGLSLRVRPAFISKHHPLAWVSGPFNAVSVYGHVTGHTMYYGRGAGGMPTASAVTADLASIAIGSTQCAFENLNIWPDQNEPADQLPIENVHSCYYLRMHTLDEPGSLAKITTILGKHNISIRSVLQLEPPENGGQPGYRPVVITTYRSYEGNVRNALTEIDAISAIPQKSVCIGIVDEHPEQL